jgi:GTP-binding protein
MFIDQVKIFVKAGDGGNGVCSFRREKYVPRGGPDGGDGGNGGDILLKASTRLSTLLDLQYQQHHVAKNGGHGEGGNRHGRNATPVVIRVPVGTIAKDHDTQTVLCDLTEDGQEAIVAQGGHGGRGNSRFASSTNRVPMQHEDGELGEARWLLLELKLLADVGLVGFPNAGKSTLISAISAAHPKIAEYPFTTLVPNLGVVRYGVGNRTTAGDGEGHSYVVADVPGLIEGAHEGKGLGFQFLRHLERTSYLLYLIDIAEGAPEDPVKSLKTLRSELKLYNPELAEKPCAVAGSKLDAIGDGGLLKELRAYCRKEKIKFLAISAATRAGLDSLTQYLGEQVAIIKNARSKDDTLAKMQSNT